MKHIALEEALRAHTKKRRLIEGAFCILSLAIILVFDVLYEQSKVVSDVHFGPITHQSVTYNTDLLWGTLVGTFGITFSAAVLIADFVGGRLFSLDVGNDHITLYRGFRTCLYINGELKDQLTVFGYYLEAPLSDRSTVTVALSKYSVHLTFSNGHPPIDL